MGYKAFISYSHAADGQFAPALQSALHKFARPFYKLRAIQVFRDQTDLSVNPALWPVIQKALDESEYFLLLASPQAAGSKWVKREIDHWLNRHQGAVDKLLIIWTDGQLVWDDQAGDFDWQDTDALPKLLDWNPDDESPKSLQGRFENEPLYLDERLAKTEKDLSLRNPRFLNDIASLAAPLHGKPRTEMIGEDVKQHKKYRRIRNAAILSLLVLLAVSTVAAIIAEVNRRSAVHQARVALSRQLAAQSRAYASNELDLSLLLAIEAHDTEDTVEARSSLLGALEFSPRLDAFLYGHTAQVSGVAFSPDDNTLVSGAHDGKIIFWNARTHQPLKTIQAEEEVNVVAYSPNGDRVVAGDALGGITIFDAATQNVLHQSDRPKGYKPGRSFVSHGTGDNAIHRIAFDAEGKRMAIIGEDTVTLWDVATGKKMGTYPLNRKEEEEALELEARANSFEDVSFIKGTEKLVTFTNRGRMWVWDNVTRQPRIYQKYEPGGEFIAQSAAFSGDGQLLAVANYSGGVDLWNTADGPNAKPTKIETGLRGTITRLAFSSDGKTVAAGTGLARESLASLMGNGQIALLDVKTGQPLGPPMEGHGRDIAAFAFTHRGNLLASGSLDTRIILWQTENRPSFGRPLENSWHSLMGGNPMKVAFSSDGQRVVACNNDGKVMVWKVAEGRLTDQYDKKSMVATTAFGADNDLLIVTGDSEAVAVTHGGTTRAIDLRPAPQDKDEFPKILARGLILSADSKVLAAQTSDGAFFLFYTRTLARKGEALSAIKGLTVATLSGDGKLLAAYKPDEKSIVVWNTEDGLPQARLPIEDVRPRLFAFSHDAKTLAVGTFSDRFILWNLSGSNQVNRALTADPQTAARSFAFSPDDRTLAIGTYPNNILLFDVSTGQIFHQPLSYLAPAQSLAFSPDGKTLASVHNNEGVILWDVDIKSWKARARRIANRELTSNEHQQYVAIPR